MSAPVAGSKRKRDDEPSGEGEPELSGEGEPGPSGEPDLQPTEVGPLPEEHLIRYARVAVDAGDIAKELFIDRRTYTWDGDVDASAICDYDPGELQALFVSLARGLDSVSSLELVGDAVVAPISAVLVHLIEQLPQLQQDVVNTAALTEKGATRPSAIMRKKMPSGSSDLQRCRRYLAAANTPFVFAAAPPLPRGSRTSPSRC